jgi:hypothetical protein
MRMVLLALFAFLATPALAAPDDSSYPMKPDTPSGLGDPNAIVCRAPQPLPGSGAMGPKICMHNSVWARLSITGQDLSADGKSVFLRPTVEDPTGDGNPDAVTCRRPAELPASRTEHGPEVCLANQQWKDLTAKQLRVDKYGQIVSTRNTGLAAQGEIPFLAVESSPPL